MPIEKDDVVQVEYIIKDEKGTLLDSSEISNGEPIKVHVGYGQVFPGFEKALIGMEVGQEKTVTLEPEEAFGEMDPLLLEKVPRDNFPEGKEIPIGKQIEYVGPSGMSSEAWVRLVEEDVVIIDMNHPLAGKTINLTIKVLEKGLEPDPYENPFQMGMSCGDACGHDHEP